MARVAAGTTGYLKNNGPAGFCVPVNGVRIGGNWNVLDLCVDGATLEPLGWIETPDSRLERNMQG